MIAHFVELALHQLWQGAALAAAAWLLLRALPRWSAESRHALWVGVLLAVAALPLLTLLPRSEAVASLELPALLSAPRTEAPLQHAVAGERAAAVERIAAPSPAAEPSSSSRALILQLLVAAWFAGFGWRLVSLARSGVVLARWRRGAIPVDSLPLGGLDVRESPHVSGPLVAGILSPCILVPPGFTRQFSASQLRLVLRHELAHIRRGDPWIVLVQRLIEAVYWYNPVVHGVSRRIESEREFSCDDRAIRAERDSHLDYAECLVEVARRTTAAGIPSLAVGAMRASGELRHRIERLLERNEDGNTDASWVGVGLAVLVTSAAAVALSLGVPRAVAQVAAESSRDATGRSLDRTLVEAAMSGNMTEVAELVAAGADVNYALIGDGTALIAAARRDDLPLLRFLMQRGADPNRASPGDGNPLIVASAGGNLEAVRELVQRGADVNGYVLADETPLINAAREGRLAVVRYLVERGADVNLAVEAPTWEGITVMRSPLGEAERFGHGDVVAFLRQRGARR